MGEWVGGWVGRFVGRSVARTLLIIDHSNIKQTDVIIE